MHIGEMAGRKRKNVRYKNDTERVDISDVSVATTVICFHFHYVMSSVTRFKMTASL